MPAPVLKPNTTGRRVSVALSYRSYGGNPTGAH
jgi:hypothetical protein